MKEFIRISYGEEERKIVNMKILVTGGAGYIGSHTVKALAEAGQEPIVLDNLCNASEKAVKRVEKLTGKHIPFYQTDIRDREGLAKVFEAEKPDAVIHFAGLKAVGESVHKPWEYYDNNITGTLTLLDVMRKHNCKNIIFSSSATVYGDPAFVPITEECPKGSPASPYGWTKTMLEQILMDMHTADKEWNVVLLRYFNPIGADPSGMIGEDPKGIPNNLMPYITQVAIGKRDKLHIFGNDYDTEDGTCKRDYIHVSDLAAGHVAALKKLTPGSGVSIYNLGTGRGTSVMELVNAFMKATGVNIPYVIDGRRAGDVPAYWCCADKAEKELGWKAEKTIEDMCRDSWNWQQKNPDGYGE
jgi:UDP-glucose 4-epimerase